MPLQLFKDVPILGQVNVIATAAVCTGFTGGNAFIGAGCAAGATSIQTLYDTGSLSEAAEAGAITGAEGLAFAGVGSVTDPGIDAAGKVTPSVLESAGFSGGENYATQIAGDGLVGGLGSLAQGGSFQSGFLAAGFSAAAGPLMLKNTGPGTFAADVVEQSVEGGIGSVLGGGKFGNGAVTGAFGYLFNRWANSGNGPNDQHAQGVQQADQYLQSQGATILGENVRAFFAFLPVRVYDLAASYDGLDFGVEVKTSSVNLFGLNPVQVLFDAYTTAFGSYSAVGELHGVLYVGVGFGGEEGAAFKNQALANVLHASGISSTTLYFKPSN
jgi:hypothetical protein